MQTEVLLKYNCDYKLMTMGRVM